MPIKQYYRPTSLEEATELLTSFAESARILAGGTDLLTQLSEYPGPETHLVSLRDIKELRGIRKNQGGQVSIGAMVRHAELARDPIVNRHFPALARASALVGSPSIRNRGTVGGNICNASPSADTAPPLLAYDARVVIWTPSGEREEEIQDFFTGPSATILGRGQILRRFILSPRRGLIAAYEKLGIRKAMEIGIVNACVSIVMDERSLCSRIRIALGAVAPTPIRSETAENILRGQNITHELIRMAAEAAMEEAKPISDMRASAAYRREMIGVLIRRMVSELAEIHDA